ncbi:MAG: SDR family oxidoreductase [Deltaproteobacteria bacterium]|nr:SDR family oxidoreductase [Deltaproteobacteria bacterium]
MKNPFSYSGKRCLFAGCFSGMGEATARIVESLGGAIVAADIKKPTTFGYERFHEIDLRDGRAIEQLVAETARGGPIDRVFYCAGLPGTKPTVDVIAVNFVGLRHLVETAIPHMPRGGAAVGISSAAGLGYMGAIPQLMPLLEIEDHGAAMQWVNEHQAELEPYSFSKMCTIVYTLRRGAPLAIERGIRLNCTSPGPTDTPMMPHFVAQTSQAFFDAYPKPIGNRFATAEEQGWPLAFLNSDAASYIAGENLYTDGGGGAAMMLGSLQFDVMAAMQK